MLERFYKMNLLKVVLVSAVALAAPAYSAELAEERPVAIAVHGIDIFDAIYYPCRRGDLAAVTAYLDGGGNVNACLTFYSLLGVVAEHNHLPLARLLIEQGADVNLVTLDGSSALMKAACIGSLDIVELLLENAANPNLIHQFGETALDFASSNGHSAVVEVLLTYGASHDDLNGKQDAFRAACAENHLDTMKILHNHETNFITPSQYDDFGASFLFEICKPPQFEEEDDAVFLYPRFQGEHQLSLVKQLSAFGFPIDALDADNRTPISYLPEEYHAEIIAIYMSEFRETGSYI